MIHRVPSLSHRWTRLIACALALPLAGSLQAAQAATLLSFLSSPYSYVGGGETVSAGPANGFEIGVQGDPFTMLDFSGNGRGNNSLTGSFNILESNIAEDGTFSFAVDFLQYDEEITNWWIKGALRYNSDVPVNLTPEPIVVDPPIDLGYNPDPYPYLPIINPVIEDPGIGEPWPDGSSIDPPISILPYPNDHQNMPVHWPCCSMVVNDHSSAELVAMSYPSINSDPVPTPGPLPIAGALAGWHSARRLRRRCRESSQRVAKP